MCPCKKNGRIEILLRNLEGFFEYVGSPQSGSRVYYSGIYEELLTSLYQLDDNGNKVVLDWNNEHDGFTIDVNKPVYVGSLRDNSDSDFISRNGDGHGNLYNDIVNLGFKPAIHEFAGENVTLRSFIIDAEEDSILPITYFNSADFGDCRFSSDVKALCLPKVNFYIYPKYDSEGMGYLPVFSGSYGIKRNGYEMIGNYEYNRYVEELTGAVDSQGNIITRCPVSVLMLPIHSADSSKFKLFGHSDGIYSDDYDVEIEEYSFDSSVDYGQEVNARGVYDIVHVNFVNADSNHADLVPTDSCQFIGNIVSSVSYEGNTSLMEIPFGIKWGDELNDIYCNLSSSLRTVYNIKSYIDTTTEYKYMIGVFSNGLYNTRFIDDSKSMYLYNVEDTKDISISDTIELSVKRLPVINLAGKISKSDFDSSKPYIYILRDDVNGSYGLQLCKYTDLDSDLILQVTDNDVSGIYRKLTKQTSFTIYCSSTAPDTRYSCYINDGNATEVYRLVCQPTEMNEEVQYTLTKL